MVEISYAKQEKVTGDVLLLQLLHFFFYLV